MCRRRPSEEWKCASPPVSFCDVHKFRLPRSLSLSRHVVCVLAVVPAVKFDTFYMTVIRPPITSPLLLLSLSPSSQDALRRITRSPSPLPRSLPARAHPISLPRSPHETVPSSVAAASVVDIGGKRQVQVARPPVFYSPNRRRKNEDPISLRSKLTNGREREGAEDPSR